MVQIPGAAWGIEIAHMIRKRQLAITTQSAFQLFTALVR